VHEDARQLQPRRPVLELDQALADLVGPFVGDEPGRAWQQRHRAMQQIAWIGPKRRIKYCAFGFVEQHRVVDESTAALDVVERMAGKRAPRRLRQQEAQSRLGIDGDAAVAKVRQNLLEPFAEFFERARMDQDVGTQRPRQVVVAILDRGAQVALGIR
jgi:hypothetical protein